MRIWYLKSKCQRIGALINACFKWFKVFLALRFKKISFFEVQIFEICIKFLDVLLLEEFLIVFLILLPSLTTLFSLILKIFKPTF